jgi:RNA polymerase sigma-70 factor (ECF subfamily)
MTEPRIHSHSAAGGPEERFRSLFARHYPHVYGYAARRLGRADAGDVAAEVFTVAWKRLSKVPEGDGELPWLYGVSRNVVANAQRSRRRRERLDARLSALRNPEASPPAVRDDVLDAVAGLDPRDREILMLAAWEGLGPRDIGAVLGCSPNAAAVRLHRARRRLVEALDGGTP